MKRKLLLPLIILFVLIAISLIRYLKIFNESVETLDRLIGKDYSYIQNNYYKVKPECYYKININSDLNEFDCGILSKKEILTDSIIYVYTWHYCFYKETIWVGKTKRMNREIIDAIRYKNNVRF